MTIKKAVTISLVGYAAGFVLVMGGGLVFGNTPPSAPVVLGIEPRSGQSVAVSPGSAASGTTPAAANTPPASPSTTTASPSPGAAPTPSNPTLAPSPSPSPSTAPSPAPQPAPAPTPAPVPPTLPPPAPACGSGGSCSSAQVAAHNSSSDCWVVYGGKVYNVTAFVPQHPGGVDVFNSTTCGHDITAYLSGAASSAGQMHRHSATAYSQLNSYYIADLK